jgi:hypothetical protein
VVETAAASSSWYLLFRAGVRSIDNVRVETAAAMNEPVILTAEDFTDGRCTSLKGCVLVLAHADLVGVAPAEGDTQSDARELLDMALEIAGDFPEMKVALLNSLAHPETSEQLSVYVSEYGTQCAALIFAEAHDPHFIAAGGNETLPTLRQWILGILLAWGYRPTTSRKEIVVRLAYDLAQPPEFESPDPRWDDREIRTMAILAATKALAPVYEGWVPGFDTRGFETGSSSPA